MSLSSSTTTTAYADAAKQLREINALEGINGLIGWDEMTMMPPGASGCRGAQKEALAGVLYDKRTDAKLGERLLALKGAEGLSAVQNAVVRDALKDYQRTMAIPRDLAQRIALLESTAYEAWVEARKSSDFDKFQPSLQSWVDINKERARLIDPQAPAYDVLVDMFEKGMTTARLDEIFTEVRAGLVPLIADIKSRGTAPDASWLEGSYDVAQQAKMCEEIALDLGFDKEKGRLDVSVHPFTGGSHPTDVRMTTRFKVNDLTEGLTGAVHETGHALYEQGRNLSEEWRDLPVSAAMSMGMHESQSLLWERMVALGLPFQKYLLPKIRKYFPDFPPCTPEKLYEAQNTIKDPSLIRVEADEVTYTLHVVLRYEIERALMSGELEVKDVPAKWNEKMQQYLSVTPPDAARGCLQDIHWAGGAFGYFPTYSLGAMCSVQIYEHAKANLPDLEAFIEKGDFAPLRKWLNKNIHEVGSLYATGDDLMTAVTGKPLNPKIYIKYLRDKYTAIYKL